MQSPLHTTIDVSPSLSSSALILLMIRDMPSEKSSSPNALPARVPVRTSITAFVVFATFRMLLVGANVHVVALPNTRAVVCLASRDVVVDHSTQLVVVSA